MLTLTVGMKKNMIFNTYGRKKKTPNAGLGQLRLRSVVWVAIKRNFVLWGRQMLAPHPVPNPTRSTRWEWRQLGSTKPVVQLLSASKEQDGLFALMGSQSEENAGNGSHLFLIVMWCLGLTCQVTRMGMMSWVGFSYYGERKARASWNFLPNIQLKNQLW